MKNYYHILGLSIESKPSTELITQCYKALVKIFHPDVFKGNKKLGEEKIRDINEAYEVLKDKKKRKKYDEKLKEYLNSQKRKENFKEEDDGFNRQENFDFEQFDKDWKLVEDIYPNITEIKIYLSNFSIQLAFQFQVILLNSKEYEKAEQIKEILLKNFLSIKFGQNKLIRELGQKLYTTGGYSDLAEELSRYCLIIGEQNSTKLIEGFFKKFPAARNLYEESYNKKSPRDHYKSDFETNKKYDYKKLRKTIAVLTVIFVISFIVLFLGESNPNREWGRITFNNGAVYEGYIENGVPHGRGRIFHKGCTIEKGFYKNNKLDESRPYSKYINCD